MSDTKAEWEKVLIAEGSILARIKVDGGFIYRSLSLTIDKYNMVSNKSESMVFVPEIDLNRYQAHLRDAYSQGFKDGQEDAHSQYQPLPLKEPS